MRTVDKVLLSAIFFVPLVTVISDALRIVPWTPEWFGAYGSWLSGLGSFAAAGAALWVSTQEQRNRLREQRIGNDRRRRVILARIQWYSHEVRAHFGRILHYHNNGNLRTIFERGDYDRLREVMINDMRLNPADPVNELPYIPEISVFVIGFEQDLMIYFRTMDHIRNNIARPPLFYFNAAITHAAVIERKAIQLTETAAEIIRTLSRE